MEVVLFYYDGWNLMAEVSGAHPETSSRRYIWGTDLSGTLQGAGGVGGLLGIAGPTGKAMHLPCTEVNGNVMGLIGAVSGELLARWDYDAFGNVVTDWVKPGSTLARCPFKFSTKYQDEETGLVYYGFRYHDPVNGRWVSKDPLAEVNGERPEMLNEGPNLYGFIGNDAQQWDYLGLIAGGRGGSPAPRGGPSPRRGQVWTEWELTQLNLSATKAIEIAGGIRDSAEKVKGNLAKILVSMGDKSRCFDLYKRTAIVSGLISMVAGEISSNNPKSYEFMKGSGIPSDDGDIYNAYTKIRPDGTVPNGKLKIYINTLPPQVKTLVHEMSHLTGFAPKSFDFTHKLDDLWKSGYTYGSLAEGETFYELFMKIIISQQMGDAALLAEFENCGFKTATHIGFKSP